MSDLIVKTILQFMLNIKMCNAISTAHPKCRASRRNILILALYMDIHVSSPAMGARYGLVLLTRK
jgi:hypothetical protein